MIELRRKGCLFGSISKYKVESIVPISFFCHYSCNLQWALVALYNTDSVDRSEIIISSGTTLSGTSVQ